MSPSPTALRSNLTAAADELQTPLTGAQVDVLLEYLVLLQKWNSVYNLTSVRDPEQMLTLHLIDSLSIVNPLRKHLQPTPHARLLDVGSGAGLPGVVIAALNPQLAVTCVETVGKKAAFLRQAVAELRLSNLLVENVRVENLAALAFDVITARAFASLKDFVALTRTHLAPGGVWLAMKGKTPDGEIAALGDEVQVFHVEHLQVPGLQADRCLVWLKPRR